MKFELGIRKGAMGHELKIKDIEADSINNARYKGADWLNELSDEEYNPISECFIYLVGDPSGSRKYFIKGC